jgi:hydroxypyruvate isomerase
MLEEIVYNGWAGCKYRPAGKTFDGLDWFHGRPAKITVA